MRTCPYCGKKYPDNLLFCPVDQRALNDDRIHWDKITDGGTPKSTKGTLIKTIVAGVAYLPMIILIVVTTLIHKGILSEDATKPVVIGCVIFNFPAFSILWLIKSFDVSWPVFAASALVLMFMWSSFLAWFFWSVAAMFMGEEEPPATRGKYDWAGFQVRFVIGFIVGFLIGWRFVRDTKSMEVLFTASLIGGLLGGFIYGLSRPPDFWSRG